MKNKYFLFIKKNLFPGLDIGIRKRMKFTKNFKTGDILTLDAGCGNGAFSFAAHKKGNRVIGIDFDSKKLGRCEEFRDYFPAYVQDREGFLYADVISANRDQLLQAGIQPENILDSGICTCCNKNYFSFRRDGTKAGRMISLMMLK